MTAGKGRYAGYPENTTERTVCTDLPLNYLTIILSLTLT